MVIRQQQMETFSNASQVSFEDRMEAHLGRCSPEECRKLGAEGVRGVIRHGIHRARVHGIILERDVCKYIDVMFAFGPDFDSDPKLPWASAILSDDSINDATNRTEHLFETAKLHSRRHLI